MACLVNKDTVTSTVSLSSLICRQADYSRQSACNKRKAKQTKRNTAIESGTGIGIFHVLVFVTRASATSTRRPPPQRLVGLSSSSLKYSATGSSFDLDSAVSTVGCNPPCVLASVCPSNAASVRNRSHRPKKITFFFTEPKR